jgi:hypothetical protein
LYSAIQDNHGLGDHYVSSIPPCAQNKIFSYRVSLRNIPEPPEKLGVGLFIYPGGLTGEIFSLPLTLTPTPSGEDLVLSCYSVGTGSLFRSYYREAQLILVFFLGPFDIDIHTVFVIIFIQRSLESGYTMHYMYNDHLFTNLCHQYRKQIRGSDWIKSTAMA